MRQNILFDSDNKHDRKLESLGGVQRHQRHSLPVLQSVRIALQGCKFKEGFQRRTIEHLPIQFRSLSHQFIQIGEHIVFILADDIFAARQVVAVIGQLQHRLNQRQQVAMHKFAQLVLYIQELLDTILDLLAKQVCFDSQSTSVDQADLAFGSQFFEFGDRLLADTSGWSIDRAFQRHIIARVVQHQQVTDQILDLFAEVKAKAADQLISNFVPRQDLFDQARLSIGAIEHGKVA